MLITGASAGIGRATAEACARAGAAVAIAARRRERLEEIAATLEESHGADALVVPTDVQDEEAVDAMVEETVAEFGRLDHLVSNAGLSRGFRVEEFSTEDYRTMMATNVDGTFYATRAALPHVREAAGTLVFLGSQAGTYPEPLNPVYAATKWWTRGFAKSLSGQVGEEGVGVTVINPSEVRTEFGASYGQTYAERFDEGEVAEAEEVAEAIVYALGQSPSMVHELDLYRRDAFTEF